MSKDARKRNGLCIMTVGTALCISFLLNGSAVIAQTHVFGASSYKNSRVSDRHRDASQDKIGTRAPEFIGLNWTNSKPVTLGSLKGKTVLLHFWKGDCDCCHEAVDTVRLLQKTYGPNGLVVIGIRMGKTTDDLVERWNVKFPIAVDTERTTWKKYWNDNTSDWDPGTYLIDKKGIIRWACLQQSLWRPMKQACPAYTSLSLAIKEELEQTAVNPIVGKTGELTSVSSAVRARTARQPAN